MQEQLLLHEAEPGRRPAVQQFAGVDLRRPKGYAASPATAAVVATEGSPCPRCESRDTKFCYYNNYNTSQPRHFCKCCRRYWTKGGTLRNVPVGGGTRKKSSSSSSSSPSSASAPAAKRQKSSKSKKRAVLAPAAPATSAAEITTELVVPAAEEDSFTDLLQQSDDALALDLGFSADYPAAGLKRLGDPDCFEWPPSFDLGLYWSGSNAGFADPDPAVFMNLP